MAMIFSSKERDGVVKRLSMNGSQDAETLNWSPGMRIYFFIFLNRISFHIKIEVLPR